MQNAGLDKVQAGIKIAERNVSNLRYVDDTTLKAESEEEVKNLLMRLKEESVKAGLKLNMQKNWYHGIWFHHFMANRWGKNGNHDILFFLSSKKRAQASPLTEDGDCNH